MIISAICGASMLILLFLPESPHWFILNGKREEFLATMKEAARHNGTELTDLEELVPLPKPKDERMTRARLQFSLWSPQLRRPTLSLIVAWMSMGIIYYGDSSPLIFISPLESVFISGINMAIEEFKLIEHDFYSSVALIALAEIPAYLGNNSQFSNLDLKSLFSVNAFLMDIVGRKPIILTSMLVAAISCIATLAIPKNDWTFKISLLLLKSSVAGAFTLIR